MKTADELWDLLSQAQDLPYGAAQIALVEQVMRQVDGAGDPALAFYTRLFATTAYIYGGEPVKSFPAFSWCVADFDRKPADYHGQWTHNLLWLFKNMASSMTDFPEVPLARTYAVLDDMERRYREAGHGMQPVYKHRYLVADHVGATEEAQAWFEKWQAAPRDSLSDCAGCDPSSLANHLVGQGKYAEAVELAEPVLAGHLSCNEQPQSILSEVMVAYLLAGRPAEAADAHRRSYLIERNNLADLSGIGDHIEFCARSGNEHRGLEILQRHIDWLDRAPSPSAAMWFAADSALLLRRITELGHGDAPIRRTGKPDTTAAELAAELTTFATDLAARFDARNGTDHQSRLIRDTIDKAPYGIEVRLSPTARPAPVPAPAAGTSLPTRAAAAPAVEMPGTATTEELLDLADALWLDDREDEFAAVVDAIEARFGAPVDAARAAGSGGSVDAARAAVSGGSVDAGPAAGSGASAEAEPGSAACSGEFMDPRLAARFWRARARRLQPRDDTDAEIAALQRAIELFEAIGEPGEASRLRAASALVRGLAGSPEGGLDAVLADVAHQDEHGDPAEQAAALLRLSTMYLVLGDPAAANEASDRADALAGATVDEAGADEGNADEAGAAAGQASAASGDGAGGAAPGAQSEEAGGIAAGGQGGAGGDGTARRRLARHALVRARNRVAADRREEALAAGRVAWEFYQVHGPARMSGHAAVTVGQLTDDPAEVVAAFDEVLAAGIAGPELVARLQRGRALLALDRPAEAVDDLVEAIALCAEHGEEQAGVFARHDLALAYEATGRPAEAVEVAEEALLGFVGLGAEEPADNCRFLLAGLYREIGDTDRALEVYRELIERLADNPAGRGQVGEQAGGLLYDLDRDREAALTFQAAAQSLREAGDLAGELRVLRRRLMALNYADEVPAAEELIGAVTERYASLPEELAAEPGVRWGRSIFAFEVGNMLMRRGRAAEAVPHLRGAPERLREIGAAEDADRVTCMLAEALLRSGDPDEAVELLEAALAGMAPDAQARQTATDLLAGARDAKKS
ncbi:tetratricopeptide repeat protein [Actinoplanes sp. DH11]|uniref:tetratricopeptide repeat protein n=1 Tax=Actinoplanes sp. DH11 TaxID=2857011 RepID=UPI001E514C38|nr:tetratricopeptide repeat protein [Actinoplanes sp. DH11]